MLLSAVQSELHIHQAFRASARSEKYKNDYQSTSQTLHLRRLLSMPIFHAVGVFVDMFVFAQCIAFTREMSCGLPFFALCAQAGALIGVVRWLVSSSAGLAVSDCMHVGSTLSFFRTLQRLRFATLRALGQHLVASQLRSLRLVTSSFGLYTHGQHSVAAASLASTRH